MYSKFFHENTDGVTQEWDFSFAGGYLSRDHVKVLFWPTGEFIGVPQEPAFTFLNDTRVRVTPAVPAGGTLEIRRVTPITQALVEFNDTSDFVEDNLNVMAQQAIYAVAELVDLYQDPNLTPSGVRALLMTGLLDNPLGVGTITPAAKLEIVHTAGQVLNVNTSTDTDADIVVNRNSVESGRVRGVLNGLHVLGTSFVSLLANGIETLRVSGTGALLNGKLTVNRGAGADAIEVQTNAGQDGHIDFRRGASVVASVRSAFYGLALNATQVVAFLINGVERLRIDASGRLGIGTNNPIRPLHVVGFIRSSPTGADQASQVETLNENGAALGILRTGASGISGTLFGQSQANRTFLYSGGGSDAGLVVGTLSNTPLHFGTGNSTRMTLTAGGLFGVGTTAALRGLHLAGASGSAVPAIFFERTGVRSFVTGVSNEGDYTIVDNTAGAIRMVINSTGLIGVGTATPQRGLHLAGGVGSAVPSVRLERTGVRTFSMEVTNAGELTVLDNTAGAARLTLSTTGVPTFASNTLRVATARTVASATAAGNAGEICWDANFIYICVATDTWRRIAHATW